VKHLSTRRKRNHRDSVSKRRANAEEPKPWVAIPTGLWGCSGVTPGSLPNRRVAEGAWKGPPERVIVRRRNASISLEQFPSTAGHVQSRGKLGGPSSKAKHSLATDSELVP